jgi:hypothetical protein
MVSFRMNRRRHSNRFKKPSPAPSSLKLFNLQLLTNPPIAIATFPPNPFVISFTSLRPYFVCNSFVCHTYAKTPSNPFLCHTSKITRLKVLCLPHIRETRGWGFCSTATLGCALFRPQTRINATSKQSPSCNFHQPRVTNSQITFTRSQ